MPQPAGPFPLYVFRHAESLANEAGLIVSDPVQASRGWGLTSRGRLQVREAFLPFDPEGPLRIVTSDLLRALQTAEALGLRCPRAVLETSALLRERGFGAWEGQSNRHYEEVWAADAAGREGSGVETLAAVSSRIDALLEALVRRGGGVPTVLVGHGDVLQILLVRAQGLPASAHRSIDPLKNAEARAVPGWGAA